MEGFHISSHLPLLIVFSLCLNPHFLLLSFLVYMYIKYVMHNTVKDLSSVQGLLWEIQAAFLDLKTSFFCWYSWHFLRIEHGRLFSWVEMPQHCLGFSPPWRRLLGPGWVVLLCSGTGFCVFSLTSVELLERHKCPQGSVSLWLCVCWSNNLDLKLSCGAGTSTLFSVPQGFTHVRQTLPTGPQLPLSYSFGPPGTHRLVSVMELYLTCVL